MSDFKRLTERDDKGKAWVVSSWPDTATSDTVIDRLAAYEDTALTPEQIHALQTRNDELTAMLGAALNCIPQFCEDCSYSFDDGHGDYDCSLRQDAPCQWRWKGYDIYNNVPEFPAKVQSTDGITAD